jgi:hypothetical protein
MGRAFAVPLLLILLIINPWSIKKLTGNDADLLALFGAYIKGRIFGSGWIDSGSVGDRLGIGSGSVRDRLGIGWGSVRDRLGIGWGSVRDRFGLGLDWGYMPV